MDAIKVIGIERYVEIIEHPDFSNEFVVQLNAPTGRIIQSFSLIPSEVDILVTALLMLKEKLSKVSQA